MVTIDISVDKITRMSDIRDIIKNRREDLNMRQEELAKLVSKEEGLQKPLSYQAVQQWELGHGPKRSRLPYVAKALGLTVEELLYGTIQKDAIQCPMLRTLIELWPYISNATQEEMLKKARAEAEQALENNIKLLEQLKNTGSVGGGDKKVIQLHRKRKK